MLSISREADYATRVIVHMATAPGGRFQAKVLALEETIPQSFLFKILQTLLRHRVIRSFRGVGGGYQLAVEPAKLSLYRLVEMMEGPIGLNACVVPGTPCEFRFQCGAHDVWESAHSLLRMVLDSVTIADLAGSTQQKRAQLANMAPESGAANPPGL